MSIDAAHHWNGPEGAKWVEHQAWLDDWLEPFGEAALAEAAIRPGERVLDVGCGAGASTLAIADRIGFGGQAVGVDISALLITRAETHSRPRLSFVLADAASTDLDRLDPFDVLFSRFGVMFFQNPEAAFVALRRRLRPGGRFVFVCWRSPHENDWAHLPLSAIADVVSPLPSSSEGPGPFSLQDRAGLKALLVAAGFVDVRMRPFDHPIVFGRGVSREAAIDNAVALAFEIGPLSRILKDQPGEVLRRAAAAVWTAFAARADATTVTLNGAAWVVSATNP